MRGFHLFSKCGRVIQSQVNSMSAKVVSSTLLVYKGIEKWQISEVFFFFSICKKINTAGREVDFHLHNLNANQLN